MRRALLWSAGMSVVLLAGGCVRYPPDYSPFYQSVPLGVSAGPGGRARYAVVPDACLSYGPGAGDVGPAGGRLPAGCANAYNLMRIVERERDLLRGRKLGPAPAAPAARAAQRYIDGTDNFVGGAAGIDAGRGPATSQEEPVASPRQATTAKAGR